MGRLHVKGMAVDFEGALWSCAGQVEDAVSGAEECVQLDVEPRIDEGGFVDGEFWLAGEEPKIRRVGEGGQFRCG